MLGIWGAHARPYLPLLMTATTVAFALPIFLTPLKAALMIVVHVWGALLRIQPISETLEMRMYSGLLARLDEALKQKPPAPYAADVAPIFLGSPFGGRLTGMSENSQIIEAWNTVLFDKFCRYQRVLIEGLGLHGTKLFEVYRPQPGQKLLDIGCGFGDTSVKLAQVVGPKGSVTAVDCAPNFIAATRERADSNQVCVEALVRDVQEDDLGGPYDAAYSRFGTMFFLSPVRALKNIHKSLKPGGLLAMSVWRKRQDNPCFYTAQQVVERYIKEEDKDTTQVTCGPGPFSMAGPDMVSDMLMAAGFSEISFLRFDAPMCMGDNVDHALAMARDIGPAGESLRLATEKARDQMPEIEAALREAIAPFQREDGVWATSSTWLVSARA